MLPNRSVLLILFVVAMTIMETFAEPPYVKCAEEAKLSDAGKEKLKELCKPPPPGTARPSQEEIKKIFEEKMALAKTALQTTDPTKVEAFEKCANEMKATLLAKLEGR